MFRRLADRVSSAVASVASPSQPSPVQQLTSMGFSDADARRALDISGNNVERAAEWLLTNGVVTTSPGMRATAQMAEDDDLQRALAASLQDTAISTGNNNNNNNDNNNVRSAASRRAGQAALARFQQKNNKRGPTTAATTATNAPKKTAPTYNNNNNNVMPTATKPGQISAAHPNIKVPKQIAHHEKEEQILRCANRMAPHPKAVDMIMKSLKQLQQNPNNSKFQSIDTNSAAFIKHLNVPGTVDFLKAMNYHASPGNLKLLQLSFCDAATIYLGISALEQVQQSEIYLTNKAQLEFDGQLSKLLSSSPSPEETAKRAEFLQKCPSEPTNGGSFMQVQLGDTKISRKFDADDILQDVLHWIAGSTSTTVYDKLLAQEWYLINQNQNGAYNMKTGPHKTLQALGCWPSGRLIILGTLPEHAAKNTSSRGLGAAGIASDYL